MTEPKLPSAEHSRKRFSEDFQRHVMPQLRNLITGQARCVVIGVETFSGAVASVLTAARQLGGGHLPDNEWEALEAWVNEAVLHEALKAETEGWRDWPNLKPGTAAYRWMHGGASE